MAQGETGKVAWALTLRNVQCHPKQFRIRPIGFRRQVREEFKQDGTTEFIS